MDKVTIHTLKRLKQAGQRITMVTAYDATFARILDDAGADVLLVGDSLGMVVQGNDSTLPVTMDQMVYHCRAVSRGARRAHVVGDLPFLSYQASVPEAVKNAGRLLAEGGVSSVKLEGGAEFAETIEAIVRAGIPVMGHLGLTPQSVHRMGGFVVQGREEEQARAIFRDAQALERAGCYALVLEGVPKEL
ncbi:MAG: 3-methyl-2-oxobutanoate hydroxymethyltransferase, partial [Myxococcaceae bacterium]